MFLQRLRNIARDQRRFIDENSFIDAEFLFSGDKTAVSETILLL